VTWKTFPLHPDTPEEKQSLEDLFNLPSAKVVEMVNNLKQTAGQLGLPFGTRTNTFNSRLAQELGLWAEDQHRGDEFHRNAFAAYFVDGKNLAKHDVCIEMAVQAGLSGTQAKAVLETRSYADRVDAHWQEARTLGITAIPTFVAGFNRVVGAQRYETLAELVQAAGSVRRR